MTSACLALIAWLALPASPALAVLPRPGGEAVPSAAAALAALTRPSGSARWDDVTSECRGCRDAEHERRELLAYAFPFALISGGSWLLDSVTPGRKERRETAIGYENPHLPIDGHGGRLDPLVSTAASHQDHSSASRMASPLLWLWRPLETRAPSGGPPSRDRGQKLEN